MAKRDIFGELMEGAAAMKSHRERKLTVRTYGTFSTLFCKSFLSCLSPYHGGPTECICLVLPQCLRPFPCRCRVGFPLLSAKAIFRGKGFRGCSPAHCYPISGAQRPHRNRP